MENKLRNVYHVSFRTSGETYQSSICASIEAAITLLENCGYSEQREEDSLGWFIWVNLKDRSQTAVIVSRPLVY